MSQKTKQQVKVLAKQMTKKAKSKTLRHDVWKLWKEDLGSKQIAEKLDADLMDVLRITNQLDRSKRVIRLEAKRTFYVPPVIEIEPTLFEKLSQQNSNSNQFVLLTNDYKVVQAYHNMVNRKNMDIPM